MREHSFGSLDAIIQEQSALGSRSLERSDHGFDLTRLQAIGDRIGPRVADVAVPLPEADYPRDSTCNAFEHERALKAW